MLSLEKMSSNKAIKTENEESNIGISRTNKKHVIDVSVEKYVNDVSVKMIVVVAGDQSLLNLPSKYVSGTVVLTSQVPSVHFAIFIYVLIATDQGTVVQNVAAGPYKNLATPAPAVENKFSIAILLNANIFTMNVVSDNGMTVIQQTQLVSTVESLSI